MPSANLGRLPVRISYQRDCCQAQAQQAICAYIGISKYGTTKLRFKTGTHKQVSQYINPKIKPLHVEIALSEHRNISSCGCQRATGFFCKLVSCLTRIIMI